MKTNLSEEVKPFNNFCISSTVVMFLIFLIPIAGAHFMDHVEKKYLMKVPKKWLVSSITTLTLLFELSLTLLVSTRTELSFIESHFTVSFLLFIMVWFMQFNEFIIHRQKTPSSSAVSKTGGKGEMNAVAVRRMPLNILPSVIS
ncbi:hypothetical protein [Halobacillus sp. K22]|uniref:hypothetical protein n=1 Tax=Halobacillus sp. K22 TaxID=3457431 RepID=UPI003FCD9AF6